MQYPSLLPANVSRGLKVVRSTGQLTPAAASDAALRFAPERFQVMNVHVPEPFRYRTMVLQGAQGTGKTLTILDALLPRLKAMADPVGRERMIVVDLKGDITAAVLAARKALCPGSPLVFLNPFELFGSQPDPHEFTEDPAKITRLVAALSHRRRDARTDDFFDTMARLSLETVVKIMQTRAPGRWTWRQLYHVATNYDLHTRVLKASRIGRYKAGRQVKKTFSGIVATIESWLGQYESAFACWDHSPAVKLDEFLRGRGLLVLSCPEDQRESMAPLIRTVLKFARDRLLADTGRDPGSRTTIVLDEFADLEDAVSVIQPFFGKTRSAQVAIICAWQSWPAVCVAHGEKEMYAILDNAGLRVWFACGAESAEVAAKNCMTAEVRRPEWSYGYTYDNFLSSSLLGPHSATLNHRTELRANVLPGEIMGLGYPAPGDPRVRAFLTASHLPGPVYCEHDYGPLIAFRNLLPDVPVFRPRPQSHLWLRPWDVAEDGADLNELFQAED